MSAQSLPRDANGDTEAAPTTSEFVELLDARYTKALLEAIRTEAKPARVLAEECGASRPTVYRRLNSLVDAGLVESRMSYDTDGHHRTVFKAAVERVTVELDDSGLSLTLSTRDADGSSRSRTR
jgi:DNA-binding transcriptional ArsR family regulator